MRANLEDKDSSRFRLSDVARAIDATPKALRQWLQRDLLAIDNSKAAGSWRSFRVSDVARLAVTRELVHFGLGVREAGKIADAALEKASVLSQVHFQIEPLRARQGSGGGANRALFLVWKEGDEWCGRLLGTFEKHSSKPAACIQLDLKQIVSRAFERLAEVGAKNGNRLAPALGD